MVNRLFLIADYSESIEHITFDEACMRISNSGNADIGYFIGSSSKYDV